jgi:hypothetical protein
MYSKANGIYEILLQLTADNINLDPIKQHPLYVCILISDLI